MVLKRLLHILLIFLNSFLLHAHPFIDGIEGYTVSPIELKGTDNFYLNNETCKVNGIKFQTIYKFDFENENIKIDAKLTFTGSGATGSFEQEFPIPKDLNIYINGEKISYEVLYNDEIIDENNNDFFDKRIPGEVAFSFFSKKNTIIEISYSNDCIISIIESENIYTYYSDKIKDSTKFFLILENHDNKKFISFRNLFSIQKNNNKWEIDFSYKDFELIAERISKEPFIITLNIYNFGFDEESYFYYPIISTEYLLKQDLFFLSNEQLRQLRNAFYAIHGYNFKSQDLKEYFSGFSWYKPNPNFSESDFTEIERKNIELIRQMENQKEPLLLSEYLE